MKQAARLLFLAGLSVAFSACDGGGGSSGGGGGLYVQSCSLSCSNGVGGNQVSCGLINTFQNQDVALIFNSPVNPATVNSNTFQVIDTGTGAVPPGNYIVNGNKVSFRPRLSFDSVGNPIFGFVDGGTYQIRVPGTAQGDIPPFVQSTNGKNNEARVLCVITTDQGLIDAVPGNPLVTITFNVIDGVSGLSVKKKLDASMPGNLPVYAPGTPPVVGDRVETDSDIEFIFNDLMNLGTVVIPALAQAPFITINVDADGDITTIGDQQPLTGSYTFCVGMTQFVDQTNLQTCVRFRPTNGLPSSGQNPNLLRRVVIDVPNSVRDLKGNGVANSGKRAIIPQVINFGTVVVPTGGEHFTDASNLDSKRTGAYWGADVAGGVVGQLVPSEGGGSGRLGDLIVDANSTRTLHTSPVYAQGRMTMIANPKVVDNAYLQLNVAPNGVQYFYKKNNLVDPTTEIRIGDFIGDTLRETAVFLNRNVLGDPEIAKCRYWVENNNQLVCEYKQTGVIGNTFQLRMFPATVGVIEGGQVPPGFAYSEGFFSGGVDYVEFGNDDAHDPEENLLTNLFAPVDGGPVEHYFSDDGVFEFASIDIQAGATLRIVGENPPRLFARGTCVIADTASIDISGLSFGAHASASPIGQAGAAVVDGSPLGFHLVGGRGGPGGGHGGQGADRADYPFFDCVIAPNTALVCLVNGGTAANPIVNRAQTEFYGQPAVLTLSDGKPGQGAGGALGYGIAATTGLGDGIGGTSWPNSFPTTSIALAELATNAACKSEQMGAPGSGGAFATDGLPSVPAAVTASSTFPVVVSNTAPAAAGGDANELNLEPAGAPGPRRSLSPASGFLRGGGGGGGGGGHIADTTTTGGVSCFGATAVINVFRDHSGCGGGGAGGALQVVAGRKAQVDGRIDASGGDGGDVSTSAPGGINTYGLQAVPGGGGAGGGILMQAREFTFGTLPNRLDINGGLGGAGNFSAIGGNGGTGLVRVESGVALLAQDVALKVTPTDALDPTSAQWLSVASWADQNVRPDSYTGAQSCWMQVSGNFFALTFNPDDVGNPDPNLRYGWDMELIVNLLLPAPNNGVRRINYRNPAAPGVDPITGIPAATFSTVWGGNTSEVEWGVCIDAGTLPPQCSLGGAPVIVRFQGARAGNGFLDPCNTNVNSQNEVVQGSLTPWVTHPSDLNVFVPPPDMVRFQIVFDRSHADFASIQGVTNFRLNVTPD